MIDLSSNIIQLIEQARTKIAKFTNSAVLFTYYQIGRMIVDELQKGELRAEYGLQLLKQVSSDLTIKFGRGFSVQNLELMRNFYNLYANSSNELRNSSACLLSPLSSAKKIYARKHRTNGSFENREK